MTKAIIISTTCSRKQFKIEQQKSSNKTVGSGQYFFESIINGLKKNNCEVVCISSILNSFSDERKLFKKASEELYEDVKYCYAPIVNIPIIKNISTYFYLKKTIKKFIKENEDVFIIFDSSMSEAYGCVKYAINNKIKTVGCTMDLPEVILEDSKLKGLSGLYEKIYFNTSIHMMKLFDSYIFMTEFMNEKCNPNKKPYVIIDCIAKEIGTVKKEELNKGRPVVFYGGTLEKAYGLKTLALASAYLKKDCDIWLYGAQCDFYEDIKDLLNNKGNLLIHDVVGQEELHRLEANSSILINPRPAKGFTYYSFPSKTVEYMQSGTPVLMFKLPCLTEEYDKYINYMNDYSPEGIAKSIKEILKEDRKKLLKKAKSAKKFVESTKSDQHQCKKIIDLINSIK